jgi:hypothetical protein
MNARAISSPPFQIMFSLELENGLSFLKMERKISILSRWLSKPSEMSDWGVHENRPLRAENDCCVSDEKCREDEQTATTGFFLPTPLLLFF